MKRFTFWSLAAATVFAGLLAAAPLLADDAREGDEAGFTSLFDGKSLEGWKGGNAGYDIVDGTIVAKADQGAKLYTEKEYADFTFRFEYRVPKGGNNGIGIRTPDSGDPAYAGMEIQILDDEAAMHRNIKPYQHNGSIYGIVPAKLGHMKAVGEWNAMEITANGRRVKITLNGATIVDADLDEASTPKTADGRDHPGAKRTSGYICLAGHNSAVEFRKLRIKELNK